MAATEKTIRETISASLQLTLFGLLCDKESCEAGPEKTDEYNRAYLSNLATELLRHAGYGRQDDAEHIIKKCPEVLLFSPLGPVEDISGNLFAGTAFQYALWAMDTHMYNMMLASLPQNQRGETIRKGLLEQAKAQTEHFDFNPLITALQTYVARYEDWLWPQEEDYCCRVVGGTQKNLPAHVRQEYCNPDRSFYPVPSFTEKVFTRSLGFHNEILSATRQLWDGDLLGLGSAFAIVRGSGEIQLWWCRGERRGGLASSARIDLQAIIALYKVRTSDLSSLMQRIQLPIKETDNTELVPR